MLTGIHWSQVGLAAGRAVVLLAANPLLYIGALLMIFERGRNNKHERRFFGVRVSKIWRSVLVRWLYGIAAGILLSLLAAGLGVVVSVWEVWAVSLLALVLAAVRLRLVSATYSIGLLVLVSSGLQWSHAGRDGANGTLATGTGMLVKLVHFHSGAWLAVAGLLMIGEALLLFSQRFAGGTPGVGAGKRGRALGVFVVQLSFVVPVLVLTSGPVPVPAIGANWPWFGAFTGGAGLAAVPLLLGMGGTLFSVKPQAAVRVTARNSLLAGLVLMAAGYAAHRFGSPYAALGGVLALVSRELPLLWMRRQEALGEPRLGASPEGVRVLGVLPGSLAEQMGLKPQEVITHVNQVPVHSNYDLHFAFDQNPAYAKLQVVDEQGEVRLVGGPIYSGERNQLGLILVPDPLTGVSYHKPAVGLFHTLYLRSVSDSPVPEVRSDADNPAPPAAT